MKKETVRVTETKVLKYLGVKEVPDELMDYIGTYELREWSFGEREKIVGESSKQVFGEDGAIKSTVKGGWFRLAVMETCIRNCPLKSSPSRVYIEEMPIWLGDSLWDKVQDLNEKATDGKEAKKFELS